MSSHKRYKVIACSVFRPEFEHIRSTLPATIEYSVTWFELGLHRNPEYLHKLISKEIDLIDNSAEAFDAILFLYGLCSRSILGLTSKQYPLVIARAHDCITLFLGSKKRYQEEFSQSPGTYWFTRGFIGNELKPGFSENYEGIFQEYEKNYETYLDQFGDNDLARHIIENQEQAWIENYSRGVYVKSGLPDSGELRKKAQSYCRHRGWTYEEVTGDLGLVTDLLTGNWDNEQFLVVSPEEIVVVGSAEEIITSHMHLQPQIQNGFYKICYTYENQYKQCSAEEADSFAGKADLVIGIDAGGTFTDAVIVSLANKCVLASAKSPTTYQDFSIGIENALTQLPSNLRQKAERLSISTTLATNAIVEEKGSRTGLILIGYPPATMSLVRIGENDLKYSVDGSHDIDGNERVPLDEQSLLEAAGTLLDKGVEALAISSYMATRNPDHEVRAVSLITENYQVPVISGHLLSDDIDAVRRAQTTLLNARLIPIIEHLIDSVTAVAERLGLPDDIRLVTTEATLMNTREARRIPVRMILSGPAASIMGVRFLSDTQSAVMVDIGGTTTDIAVIENGTVRRTGRGATVGKYTTSLSATDIRTIGLGGDSWIRIIGGQFSVGPRRVLPISQLLLIEPSICEQLKKLDFSSKADYELVQPGIFYLLLCKQDFTEYLTEQEKNALNIIVEGPVSEIDLADRLEYPYLSLLRLNRLEDMGIILRAGLTPTDIMVYQNEDKCDAMQAIGFLLGIYGHRAGLDIDAAIHEIWKIIHMQAAAGIITESVGHEDNGAMFPGCHFCEQSFNTAAAVEVTYRLKTPLVGIGAPVRYMLNGIERYLKAEMVFPQWAEVANAVGAASGSGGTHIDMLIMTAEQGSYMLYTPSGRKAFRNLADAKLSALETCKELARMYADDMGYERFALTITITDKTAPTAIGTTLYIDTTIVAELRY